MHLLAEKLQPCSSGSTRSVNVCGLHASPQLRPTTLWPSPLSLQRTAAKTAALRFHAPAFTSLALGTPGSDATPQTSPAASSSHSTWSPTMQPMPTQPVNEDHAAQQEHCSPGTPSSSGTSHGSSNGGSRSCKGGSFSNSASNRHSSEGNSHGSSHGNSHTGNNSSNSSSNGRRSSSTSSGRPPPHLAGNWLHHTHSESSSGIGSSSAKSRRDKGLQAARSSSSSSSSDTSLATVDALELPSDVPRPLSSFSFNYRGDDYDLIMSSGVPLLSPIRAAILFSSQQPTPALQHHDPKQDVNVPPSPPSIPQSPGTALHPPPSIDVLQPGSVFVEGPVAFIESNPPVTATKAIPLPIPETALQGDLGDPPPIDPGGGPPDPPPTLAENFLKLWALLVLSATYVHQSSTGYSIPIMLPMISQSLSITDLQGSLLTSGYAYLYALALIPAGILADKQNRPRLLGLSTFAWSTFCALSSQATSFGDLLLSRIGLATAQSSQNVICFSMIPDLFPKNKSFALAIYNCAIYVGRGLMFVLITGARSAMFPTQEAGDDGAGAMSLAPQSIIKDASGNLLVPLDKIDLRLVQIMYTTGDMAAIRAISPFDLAETGDLMDMPLLNEQMWRTVMRWVAFPGFLLAGAMLLTVPETRKPFVPPSPPIEELSAPSASSSSSSVSDSMDISRSSSLLGSAALNATSTAEVAGNSTTVAAAVATVESRNTTIDLITAEPVGWAGVMLLVQNSAFMSTTVAAALNDVASYALVAWQSTFYERIYDLSTDQYAPVLATVLPIAGILGGVGGGILADKLSVVGKRGYVTVFASLLAAPFIWASVMADNPTDSFIALGIGFALSESWRAPAAVMARSVAPPSMSSTASAIYLSLRNIIGGLGPLAVAQLATIKDLRGALELLPLMYLFSGAMFAVAERKLENLKQQEVLLQQAALEAAAVVEEHNSGLNGGSGRK